MTPSRYRHVVREIQKLKAKVLVEVGTWNGDRAIEMLRAAIDSTGGAGTYFGFDLFEDMTAERSEAEFNVKTPCPMDVAKDRIVKAVAPKEPWRVRLFKGDTIRTLMEFCDNHGTRFVDFAWIDGGHSIETIKSDFSWALTLVRPGGVILLDDYYSGPVSVDTKKFGCNVLVDELREQGFDIEVFPEKDPVKGGGFVQVVKVL